MAINNSFSTAAGLFARRWRMRRVSFSVRKSNSMFQRSPYKLTTFSALSASVVPHGVYIGDPRLVPASLDHAMWFHRPFRADEWLLYDQVSPSASGGRGLATGRLFTEHGRLIASVAQEGMVRLRRQ